MPLTPPTPDARTIEPDVLGPWRGWRYWLAMNWRDARVYLVHSDNGLVWSSPTGAPLAEGDTATQVSDPDLVVVGDSLWLVFLRNAASRNWLAVRASADGVAWAPERALGGSMPWAGLLGPAALVVGGALQVWTVNAAPSGCSGSASVIEHRSAADGLRAVDTVAVRWPGYTPWHVDAVRLAGRLWLIVAAHVSNASCGVGRVFLAASADSGVTWTVYSRPVDPPEAFPGGTYRSTLIDEGDTVTAWWSGTKADKRSWGITAERLTLDSLLARAGSPL